MFIDRNYTNTTYQIPQVSDSQVSGIGITSNGLNIFLGIQSRVLVYQVQQANKQMSILSSCSTNGSTVSQFIFSSNETLIIALTTSQLIQIYDIQNLNSISLVGEFTPYSNLNLKADISTYYNLLYVVSGYSGLNIYSLTYSNDKPVMECSLLYQNQPGQNLVDFAKSQNDHIIYAVDSVQGVFIFNNMHSSDSIKKQSQSDFKYFGLGKFKVKLYITSIAISPLDLFIFVGVRSQGIYIFNIEEDALNPIFFQLIYYQGNPLKILAYELLNIDVNKQETQFVLSKSSGFLLVDTNNFQIITNYTLINVTSQCKSAVFSPNGKYVILIYQNNGLYFIDVQNKSQPFVANYYKTSGAEMIVSSKIQEYIYFIDGINGLVIIDGNYLPELKTVGNYYNNIWLSHLTLSFDENYGIINSLDQNQVMVIDLEIKQNPQLLSSQNFDSQQDYLKVGLYYEFEIIPIYKKENQILQDIFIWKDNKLGKLPIWINISQDFKNLTIFVSKELLKEGYQQGILTLVVKNCYQLSSSDFLVSTSQLSVSDLESQAIWLFLIKNKIISQDFCYDDEKNYILPDNVSQLFDLLKSISDSSSYNRTILILSNVQQILRQSIHYSPIKFNIESSLKFDMNDSLNTIQSCLNEQITLVLSFEYNSNLIFVNMNYQNSLISLYGQQSNTISLKSTTQNLNQILQDKIYYYLYIKDNNSNHIQNNQTIGNQQIQIELSDGINYNKQFIINIEQAHFLQLKRDIELSKPLQDQVNFLSPGASFAIETQLSINFDQRIFLDPDFNTRNQAQNGIQEDQTINDLSIVYEFYLMNSRGEYELVSSNYFLQFDSQNMRIIGSPPSSLIFQQQNYMIVARTVYCQAQDTFYLKFDQIPLSYVFNIFLKIIGPIAFLIGVYQKRYVFYNMINKKKTLYSQEKAYIYQTYRKKITLIGDELIITQLFFEKFLKIIGQPTIIQSEYQQIQEAQIQRFGKQNLQNKIIDECDDIKERLGSQNNSINQQTKEIIRQKQIHKLKNQEQNLMIQTQNQTENRKSQIRRFSLQNQINFKYQSSQFDQKEQNQNKIQKKRSLSSIQSQVDQLLKSKKKIQNLRNRKQILKRKYTWF
ncbi:transmembrane protein, putative (macronuclear) [Tetrahymena thermophila SB210]|uniref:Transmembrane protein, putative n=1 Tax=Tetrahymena thermophila (strain SB210) TaxID=312017 RepID=Q23ED1_TETTS|nr:transmembrane protein, putative [Tetrahymena thermophila SB210]EAR94822.2 transmembrane protein, putative [Tetrahymena thermophila SB210]|eukprot:XP_001015067.2 transmembrane protein, putative [Tetrahymena thermophila SB210]